MSTLSYGLNTASTAPSIQSFLYDEEKSDSATIAHILLVEDNVMLQGIHRLFIEQLGYQVTVVGSGEEALAQFAPGYDAILMDIDLPGMNGIQTTRALFQKYPQLNTPVIACTTHSASELKDECFAAGMVDYLQKPVAVPYLAKCLKENLKDSAFHA